MLQLSSTIVNQGVVSLRTGGRVASGTEPIINPNNLKIEGFYCDDRFDHNKLVLLAQDIRDHAKQGFIINDHEVLVYPDELVRLQTIMKLHFTLIGKPIVTVDKQRIGKVEDYAIDGNSLYIQKLYVTQRLFKRFGSGSLSIDRSQIVEITDRKIVIQDPLKPIKETSLAGAPASA